MQMRKHLRLTAALTAGCLVLGALPCSALTVSAADFSANYAEAMQKSLYFYECQQAGPLPDWNEVEWRADSTMTDEVTGGWYDAGDHVKFNLPMAYSASMLAWGLYQYPDGLEKTGEMETYVNNLSFVLDYLAACDEGDTAVYQVGNGQMDIRTAVNILKENDYSDLVSFEWEKLWFPEVEEPDVAFPQFLDAFSAML